MCHEFLRILARAVSARGLGNPIADNDLLGEIVPDLKIDRTFTLGELVDSSSTPRGQPGKSPETTMPNIEDHTDYMYEGYDYGSVVLPSYPKDQTIPGRTSWVQSARSATSDPPSSITTVCLTGLPTRQQQPRRLPSSGLSDTGSWGLGYLARRGSPL